MIGDPSGVSEERNLLDAETLSGNLEKITVQLEKLLDFGAGPEPSPLGQQLHVDVAVGPARLPPRDRQARDREPDGGPGVRTGPDGDRGRDLLHRVHATSCCRPPTSAGCTSTSSARCRWAAPTSGATSSPASTSSGGDWAGRAFGLTWPLLLKADGTKFGKSAGGAVWLDPERTSPYQFRQFFVQVDDEDVEQQLLWFTLLPVSEIEEVMVGASRRTRAAAGPAPARHLRHLDGPRRRRRPGRGRGRGGAVRGRRSLPGAARGARGREPGGSDDRGARIGAGGRPRPRQRPGAHRLGGVERRGPPRCSRRAVSRSTAESDGRATASAPPTCSTAATPLLRKGRSTYALVTAR